MEAQCSREAPDGTEVLCYKVSLDDDQRISYQTIVLDVATGMHTVIPKTKETIARNNCQISASGRYVIESYFFQDIWLHDLETGEVKLLVSPEEGHIVLHVPGIPG